MLAGLSRDGVLQASVSRGLAQGNPGSKTVPRSSLLPPTSSSCSRMPVSTQPVFEEESKKRKLSYDVRDPNEEIPQGPKPYKAYKNEEFLNCSESRMVRVMCELQEPQRRLKEKGIDNIVMFFGSARAKPRAQFDEAVKAAEATVASNPEDAKAKLALARLRKQEFLIPMFDVTKDLAGMLTEWSLARKEKGLPAYAVGTGAGPGMMEAANEGAWRAKGPSVGFGISLPFEDRLNPYVTPELGFEFHYFFTRKFLMTYSCMGLVVAPGGLGTCDELFEIITLMQTGKIKRNLPIILIGKTFWQSCIHWQSFVDYGMISEEDASQLKFADTAQEAFDYLISGIEDVERKEIL
mmetsp:Transcript_35221/g.93306  ORF Transcript_35221/g.93306 Transcript_35221/m.93306 type:complete len:351 (-) Transcript_35221:366-1418(-)